MKRAEKIALAITENECYVILAQAKTVGFVLFDYRFFDQGWIELVVIAEGHRGKGITAQVFQFLSQKCKAEKIFTSTNRSNLPMQKALVKSGFTYAGTLKGLDKDDPELFYYKYTRPD